jgi:galactose mutarotase-like enzyme
MLYTIKNNNLSVLISDLGGELMSIKTADGTEYLWQGNPEFWAGRAYNLFPIVGRLWEGKYTYKGTTYEMALHGFVRKSVLEIKEEKENKIVFSIKANENTLKMYPFEFEYNLIYELTGNTIAITYEVLNTGKDVLPFSVGGHPGFNVPLGGEGRFEDYYLEFDCKSPAKEIIMSERCFVTEEIKDFKLKNGKILPLKHSLFDNDAIVLTDMCKKVTLKSVCCARSVTLEYPDMKYIGLWHKPKSEAPYICIEPWSSLPAYDGKIDDMETKRDMEKLASGERYKNKYTITVK